MKKKKLEGEDTPFPDSCCVLTLTQIARTPKKTAIVSVSVTNDKYLLIGWIMVYRDDLSCEQAGRAFFWEGAFWVDTTEAERKSAILVSKITRNHLAAIWDCETFFTWRVGGQNNMARNFEEAKRLAEKCLG